MKKIIAILLVCLTMIFSVGCEEHEVLKENTGAKESMFVIVETTTIWYVVYHKETKVMYAVSHGSYNGGNFTVLVDENGKPLLWQGE